MKRTVRTADGAALCAEAIGESGHPAIILIAGAAQAMDWWEDGFCSLLAERGRLVVRYDHRDTGASTSYPAGNPEYDGQDLVTDAVAVLDELGIERAHVVGLSMGGGIAQELALQHRDRVEALSLMATSPVDPSIEGLPGMTEELRQAYAEEKPEPDWTDREAVVEHMLEFERPLAGPGMFDEPRMRAIAEQVFERSRDMAATMANHFAMTDDESAEYHLAQIEGLPTLVFHGTHDPAFPLEHGKALAGAIEGARLIELERVGHQMPPPEMWSLVADELVRLSAPGARPGRR